MPSTARVAVLASGSGSTFDALVEAASAGEMPATVVLLVVSRAEAGARTRAARRGIDCVVLDEPALGRDACDAELERVLVSRDVDLIVLAGYLRKVGPRTLRRFTGRILNTHPAPLPRFGGKGMYGDRVHQAVLDAGVTMSAATVHLVDADYDSGPVIAERPVPVFPGDGVDMLRARVQAAERDLLVATVAELVSP